ncbi:uncharacterized protein BT62DRAFT_688195 [Guyanagaster necrorhizus]|uniref:MARVEL domain-containing protein n=1 Tax=Guyanagaster necrorhizus TaxID=856835 RepID=A0A9P7VF50_9AGAR|nr:uncharacterized protein BT62DRAFT_688195 [Guyanagaster necrorhizus MCA 3950]KAG7439798.1 hypothetical protein BT62DRAFT_688195 [Guyanagaster necrorhizus MCA 3950]
MRGTNSYTLSRAVFYALLWSVAVILLALTAYRIHFTKSYGVGYEPIIVELLVSSILTVLWVPLVVLMIFVELAASSRDNARHPRYLPFELLGLAILWVMWLVGAVYTTNRILPGRNWCIIGGRQCNILSTLLAFAWIGWSLLMLLGIMALMHSAHGLASDANTGTRIEKNKGVVSESTHTGTGQPAPTQPTNV